MKFSTMEDGYSQKSNPTQRLLKIKNVGQVQENVVVTLTTADCFLCKYTSHDSVWDLGDFVAKWAVRSRLHRYLARRQRS